MEKVSINLCKPTTSDKVFLPMNPLAKIAIAVTLINAANCVKAATVFSFQFDNQGRNGTNLGTDGPIIPPVIGTGQFVSPVDLAPGTYNLSSLPGFTMNFSFNDGKAFNQTEITTPITGVAVNIVASGAGERLFFESGGAGANGGASGGSLDLDTGGNFLSFEPTYVGGNFDYYENSYSGRYLGTASVPEPAPLALLGSGLIALALVACRRSPALASRAAKRS